MKSVVAIACLLASLLLPQASHGREWTDATGRFKVEADLIAVNEDIIVLKTKDSRLIAVEIAQLSKANQEFLKSDEAGASKLDAKDTEHTWRLIGEHKVTGRIVGYFAQDMVVERRNAKLFVDETQESDLPELTRLMLPHIVGHFETAKVKDIVELKAWLSKRGKMPHVYSVEGVRIALTRGEEVKVPIFLFASGERKVLEPGLARWKALQKEKLEDIEKSRYSQREALMLSSAARAYQQDQAFNAQAQMMQLNLLAVNAGITQLWEVLLVPRNPYAYPFTVVVPAPDSASAQIVAAQNYPGYQIDATRKLSFY